MAKFLTLQREQQEKEGTKGIKPQPTTYKGIDFRSKLEARWAAFFDTFRVDWAYEPEQYTLDNGLLYKPDFLLHNVRVLGIDSPVDIFVEVKGVNALTPVRQYDATKVKALHKPIFVLGNIPCYQQGLIEFADSLQNEALPEWIKNEDELYAYNAELLTILHVKYPVFPYVTKDGVFEISKVSDLKKRADVTRTEQALRAVNELFKVDKMPKKIDIHEYAREHTTGKIILDALKMFVPADFCHPSEVGSTGYYDELLAVGMFKCALQREAEEDIISQSLFTSGNSIKKEEWDRMVGGWRVTGALSNNFGKSTIGQIYQQLLKRFGELILSGFEDAEPKRKEFWDKFLRQHIDGTFDKKYPNLTDQLAKEG